ncbi:SRPBCC family protein [Aquirhabdus parva]|nr:SRPBCC family protein [Aquirhabdus parva]
MTKYFIEVTQNYQKPVETIFQTLSDHNQLGRVLGIPVKRVINGNDGVNGAGSVRRMGIWPLTVEETVVAVEPNRSIDYRISRGGAPLKNHIGALVFDQTASGSQVIWRIKYDSSLPFVGAVVQHVLKLGLRLGLKRLK